MGTTDLCQGSTITYPDWFIAPNDAVLKGLPAAFLNTIHKEYLLGDLYGIAKPHVPSLQMCIKMIGHVAFGITDQGNSEKNIKPEYQYVYFRMRRMIAEERAQYVGTHLSQLKIHAMSDFCREPIRDEHGDLYFFPTQENPECRVGIVEFYGLKGEENLKPGGSQGRFFEIMQEQGAQDYVLTAYETLETKAGEQRYLVVFEKSLLSAEKKQELLNDIEKHRQEELVDV